MATPNKIVVLQTGRPAAEVEAECGSFADMVIAAIGSSWAGGYAVIDAVHSPLPQPSAGGAAQHSADGQPAAVVITGSPASVAQDEPWMVAAQQWLRVQLARRVPVFGICFGHQLLARALGGTVALNPQGREAGTTKVEHLSDDELLAGLDRCFEANTFHDDTVVALPAGARSLARSARDQHQCVRFSPSCYGVQFHPEFDEQVMGAYLRARAEELRLRGLDPGRLLARATDAPQGRAVLRRFIDRWVVEPQPSC